MSRPHGAEIGGVLSELANLQILLPPIPQDIAEDLLYEEQVEYFGDMA